MITKTETIVYNILEEKDLEDAVEKITGKKYKVSFFSCSCLLGSSVQLFQLSLCR